MRKFWYLVLIVIVCACTTAPNTPDIDGAIILSSYQINRALDAGTKVALLNISSPSDVLSDYILEEISIHLVRGQKIVVVDRKEIDLIRSEMDFQMSSDVSDESAQEIGKMLGAQSIVSGSLISLGDTYRLRVKVIDVNTAAIQASFSLTLRGNPQIQYLIAQGNITSPRTSIARTVSEETPLAVSTDTVQTVSSYRIGDTGPAGGLIFYDKGNNSGGWRYLEAAPEEAEFQAQWSVRGTRVENTRDEIGSGRRNTNLIIETFSQASGEWDTAAQKCDDLVYDGFDDWFLPSGAELDQMYGNLKRRNLGDFKNDIYWSSTRGIYSSGVKQNFRNGEIDTWGYQGNHFVRPIRQVPGPAR